MTPLSSTDIGSRTSTRLSVGPHYRCRPFGAADGTSVEGVNPQVVSEYDTSVQVAPWRGNPRFVDILMVTLLANPNFLGDYHLTTISSAINFGTSLGAPAFDFDDQVRPFGTAIDAGADEVEVNLN
jgi:hypothetical protein